MYSLPEKHHQSSSYPTKHEGVKSVRYFRLHLHQLVTKAVKDSDDETQKTNSTKLPRVSEMMKESKKLSLALKEHAENKVHAKLIVKGEPLVFNTNYPAN